MTAASPKSCLPPVVDSGTRLLVCGSLPGEASLRATRYYAHPQNQFWGLLGAAIGEPLAEQGYDDRLDTLLLRGIGLWDVVASATREGSLDQALRGVTATPLAALAGRLPRLRAVAFNGATAARIGRRSLAGVPGLTLADLPSSSPAYTLPFAAKAERWAVLGPLLG